MSQELRSALRGSVVGLIIGIAFGLATLGTIGFGNFSFAEGLLLGSCSAFGGALFGSLIGSTGAFRRESASPVALPKTSRAIAY
jgi:hypothetical protein